MSSETNGTAVLDNVATDRVKPVAKKLVPAVTVDTFTHLYNLVGSFPKRGTTLKRECGEGTFNAKIDAFPASATVEEVARLARNGVKVSIKREETIGDAGAAMSHTGATDGDKAEVFIREMLNRA